MEYPQNIFTIRAIHEELRGLKKDGIEHEIIAIDNLCPEIVHQLCQKGIPIDRAHERPKDPEENPPEADDWYGDFEGERDVSHIAAMAKRLPWLTYIKYEDKLSHWQAKNAAVAVARGDLLLFADAHVVPARDSLCNMMRLYGPWTEENGLCSFHAPLSYHILEDKRLVYKLSAKPEIGELHYSFSDYRKEWDEPGRGPVEVPCMSTCGMLISRAVYDLMGGWPKALGIYGGGENFQNFTQAVMGIKKYIVPGRPLHHYGENRLYFWNWNDHKRNQGIAAYCYGGMQWLTRWARYHPKYKNVPEFFEALLEDIPANCAQHRKIIKANQKYEVEEWIALNS
jgi:hypothetical protein